MVSEAEGRVRVESRKTLSSFVIEGAVREDEGRYSITVTNPAGEDHVDLFVKVVGQWLFLTVAFLTSSFPFFVAAILFLITIRPCFYTEIDNNQNY